MPSGILDIGNHPRQREYNMAKSLRIINDTSHIQHNKLHYIGTPRHVALLLIAKRLQLRNNIQKHHVSIKPFDKVA
jgi:hypothetical protein